MSLSPGSSQEVNVRGLPLACIAHAGCKLRKTMTLRRDESSGVRVKMVDSGPRVVGIRMDN